MRGNSTCMLALLCLLSMLCPYFANGQTYQAEADNVLAPLNKNYMTTKTLYDRVVSLADLTSFDGSEQASASNSDHFWQAYSEIHQATYDSWTYQDPEQVVDRYNGAFNANTHALGIICHRFDALDTTAVQRNLLQRNNGQLFDVAGRSESPYKATTVFVGTPMAAPETAFTEGWHNLDINPSYFLGNLAQEIQQINVDLEDGQGYREVYNYSPQARVAGPILAFFLVKGAIKTIRILIKLRNGEVKRAVATIRAKPERNTRLGGCNGGDSFEVTGLTADLSRYGESNRAGEGTAYLFYANDNCAAKRITRPVIFLDGFDPSNDRNAEDIYNEFIDKEFPQDLQRVRLGNELRGSGYDLIVFDYKKTDSQGRTGGGDFIEVNALAVVKLIQELRSRYGNTIQQDFVIIGPSMGSLIAQYALAYMERNGIEHHTRLFISFDGIHQGANIPIGVQQLVNHLGQQGLVSKVFKGIKNGIHNSRAARQMILHHADSQSESPAPHPWRSIFLQNLSDVGTYPARCRKVAIINGNNQATPNAAISQCQNLIDINVWRKDLGRDLCTGQNCLKIDWEASAGVGQRVCRFKPCQSRSV